MSTVFICIISLLKTSLTVPFEVEKFDNVTLYSNFSPSINLQQITMDSHSFKVHHRSQRLDVFFSTASCMQQPGGKKYRVN